MLIIGDAEYIGRALPDIEQATEFLRCDGEKLDATQGIVRKTAQTCPEEAPMWIILADLMDANPLAALPASKVLGAAVVDASGEQIAEIEDIVRRTGEEELYAVLSVGGFLGIGDRTVVVALEELEVAEDGQIVLSGASREQLEQLPEFNLEEYETMTAEGLQRSF